MVIGASDYKELGKLNYAAKDAQSFAGTLQERFDFKPEAIELITDDKDSASKPTIENIKAALARQLADPRLNDGDLFIFYFSGHGIGTSSGDFLMPTDSTGVDIEKQGLPMKDIVSSFVKAGLKNVLFIADACRGGEKNSFGAELQELGDKANIAVLLSCAPGSRSYEYPRLGGGVFTSYLLKALKDKEIQDPASGALWASNVAESVSAKVPIYTERDYPNSPQRPTAWTEKTQDLLLGAFSDVPLTDTALAKITKEASKLSAEKHAQALVELAEILQGQKKFEDVVALLKTVDGIGQATPSSLFTLTYALNELGRSKEGAKISYRLAAQTENLYFQNLAAMTNPDRKVLAPRRIAAAKDLWKLDHSWSTTVIVSQTFVAHGTTAEREAFLEEAKNRPGTESWIREALQAEQDAMRGKWPEAIAAFGRSIDQCPQGINRRLLLSLALPTIAVSEDPVATALLLDKINDEPDYRKMAWIIEASLHSSKGDKIKAIPILVKLLNDNPDPEHLYYAVRIAGHELPSISKLIEREAKRYPYAWKAHIAKALVCLLVNGDAVGYQESLLAAEKYCEDELGITIAYGQVLIDAYTYLYLQGKVSDSAFERIASTVYLLMLRNRDQFVQDSEAWQLFIFCGFMNGRQYQLQQIFESDLGDQLKKNQLDPALRPFAALLYMATGASAEVQRLAVKEGVLPKDLADWETLYLLYWQLKDEPVARGMKMPPDWGLSKDMAPVREAVKFYANVLSATSVDVSTLESVKPDHVVQKISLALAWEKFGKVDKAEALMRQVLLDSSGAMPFIQEKASSWLYNFYKKRGRWKEANQALYAQEILQTANPWHRDLVFLEDKKPAKYEGTWSGDVSVRVDRLIEGFTVLALNGKATLSLEGGKLKAHIRFTDGNTCDIEATLDSLGNSSGSFKLFDDEYKLAGKFTPPQIISSTPEMEKLGPTLLGLDKDFGRLIVLFQNLKRTPK